MKFIFVVLLSTLSLSLFAQADPSASSNGISITPKDPCFNKCDPGKSKGKGVSDNCYKCLEQKYGIHKADPSAPSNGFSITPEDPCFNKCAPKLSKGKGVSDNCFKCLEQKYGIHKIESDLSNCDKSDDGQSISCPDGLYLKSGSVNDSLRSVTEKDSDGKPISKEKSKSSTKE